MCEHRQWPKTRKAANTSWWKKWESCGRCSLRISSCNMCSRATEAKTSQENAEEPTSVARGWTTQYPWQYSLAHRGFVTKELSDYGWELLPYAPYIQTWVHQTSTYSQSYKNLCVDDVFSSLEELSTDATRRDDTLAIRYMNNKRYGHTAHTFSRLISNVLIWERFISIRSGFQTTRITILYWQPLLLI